MKRVLCVRFLRWPLQRRYIEQPKLEQKPLILHAADPRRGDQVRLCCPRARRLGVAPNMPLAEAKALLDGQSATFLPDDPTADRTALEQLARCCRRFSPVVGLDDTDAPESLLLDITGCGHLFGGEQALAENLRESMQRRRYQIRIALADTIGSAWAVAHYASFQQEDHSVRILSSGSQAEALRPLPIEALRISPEVTERLLALDIRHIEQLLSLPRAELPARFGTELIDRLDQALGQRPELVHPVRDAKLHQEEWIFEEPVSERFIIEAVVERLIEALLSSLTTRKEGVRQLDGWLIPPQNRTADVGYFSVSLVRPCASVKHLLQLIQLQLERIRLPEEIARIRLCATAIERLPIQQESLFGEDSSRQHQRELAALWERLSSRLGRQAVLRPRLVPDAQPEYSVRFDPVVADSSPRDATPDGLDPSSLRYRPTRLKEPPELVPVMSLWPDGSPIRFDWNGERHVVRRVWGPERIETGWWRAENCRRDYYCVETERGEWFWLFRQIGEGTWYLHGLFD